jgi:hypothetical protein
VKEYHLLNPVIVDCTSSQAVADQYADFLREGFRGDAEQKGQYLFAGLLSSAAPCQQLAVSSSMTPTLALACR